jgi:AP-2 complex subunit mu-1
MFTSSGLVVRFLKVFEKSNYHSIKWVRYLTKASGTYQIRVSRRGFPGNITLIEPSLDHSFSESRYIYFIQVVELQCTGAG